MSMGDSTTLSARWSAGNSFDFSLASYVAPW